VTGSRALAEHILDVLGLSSDVGLADPDLLRDLFSGTDHHCSMPPRGSGPAARQAAAAMR
jgi:hypothetical protein